MDNKLMLSTTPLSKNYQTIYCDKDILHDKGLEPHVTLKYIVFIFLDLKQMATVYFWPIQLLCVEITGMLMIWEFQQQYNCI